MWLPVTGNGTLENRRQLGIETDLGVKGVYQPANAVFGNLSELPSARGHGRSGVVLAYSSVLLRHWCRNAAGFGGAASNLERITCRKCAFQFLLQLEVELSLLTLCESFS